MFFFFSSYLNFFFSEEIFLLFFSCLSFRLVYRWNWIFLLSHGGQSLQQLPSHSKVPQHCEREKYRGRESIKKTVIASISLSLSLTCYLHLSLGLSFLHSCPSQSLPSVSLSGEWSYNCKVHFARGVFKNLNLNSKVRTLVYCMFCCLVVAIKMLCSLSLALLVV